MNMGTVIFTLLTLALMFAPIIPALFEWLKPTDNKALKIVQEFDSDTGHFAQGFADYVKKNFASFIAGNDKKENEDGVLKDGTGFTLLYDNETKLSARESKEKTLNRLLLAANVFELPSGISYHKEIYGKDSINSGENNNIRAVFAGKNLTIQNNSTIIRWAHADETLRTDGKCTLYGRISAGNSIIISENSSFERMRAPIIQFGEYSEKSTQKTTFPKLAINGVRALETLPNLKEQDGRRWLISGDLEIAPNSLFNGDIIATGDIIIGAGSVINGSVKSNGKMWLKDFVQINGSAVSAGDLEIAEAVEITNPIIAEGKLTIGKNSIIGTETQPTSVNAPVIHCYNGVRVYGTIWAYNNGLMLGDGEVRV